MLHQIIEIYDENRYLSLERGFLVVSYQSSPLGKVSLDDISVLLLSAQSAVMSKSLLAELANRNIIVVVCGKNYAPVGLQIPIVGNFKQTAIIKNQINASLPLKKNIWKAVVTEKIENQSKVLKKIGNKVESALLKNISKSVLSGDSNNREAYAARVYWKALFGKSFIRDKNLEGVNSLLNYGYAIVRAAILRSICSKGLIPSLGVHHDNLLNPACLADDLFEPFRPLVDLLVYNLVHEGNIEVNTETKKTLVELLWMKLKTTEGYSPLFQSFYYYISSFSKCLEIKKPTINIPFWEGKFENVSRIE
jgi:CRISPR-associated protein Cas1